jgi:NAD+ kinase
MTMSGDGPARVTRVGIVAKRHLYEAAAVLDQIASWLSARGVQPIFEIETAALCATGPSHPRATREALPDQVDLVLVLGGDGTLLGMADRIALGDRTVPILGVNFGSLGFLTEITLPELYPALESVLADTAEYDERCTLRAALRRADGTGETRVVLNDVVVTKGALSRIIDLTVWVGGQFVARFKADGLIVASPTGSTAYNLAAGGPIVHPQVDAMVLTPIAPHTLTNRPIVLPAARAIEIRPVVDDDPREIFVTFDGQETCSLGPADAILVTREPRPVRMVRAVTRNYFEVLRQKLKWAER